MQGFALGLLLPPLPRRSLAGRVQAGPAMLRASGTKHKNTCGKLNPTCIAEANKSTNPLMPPPLPATPQKVK